MNLIEIITNTTQDELIVWKLQTSRNEVCYGDKEQILQISSN